MEQLKQVNTAARWGLGLLFIYHGLLPKILFLDPVEVALTNAHFASNSFFNASWISPLAGVGEAVFGVLIIILRRAVWPAYLAAVVLALLLLDVAVVQPQLLPGAFNPVTTNGLGILLSLIIHYSKGAFSEH